MLQSVQLLRQRSPNPKVREVLADVEARIKSGSALSEALEAQSGTFRKIYTASILAGERSGNLDDVLRRYVAYTKAMAAVRRKIRGALTYPLILLGASLILISVLTTFVIPQFSAVYENIGAELPTVTVVVVGMSTAVRANLYWLGPLLLGLGALLYMAADRERAADDRRADPQAADHRRPGPAADHGAVLAQPGDAALGRDHARRVLPDRARLGDQPRRLVQRTEPALPKVREGRPFTERACRRPPVPGLAVDMIGVGERSGSLREMLDEVAGFTTPRPRSSSGS